MAFPAVQTVAESNTTSAGTSHVVTLPSGITAGDLLVVILDKGSTSATINALAGWTELLDEASANGLYVAYRQADGSEGASITLTSSASTRSAQIAYRISGAENPATQAPQVATTATGTSATPDPPSITPTGGAKDYLFIAFAGMAGEEADDDSWGNTSPTSYTPSPPRQISCGVAGTNLGGLILSAERQLNAASDNPGTFGVDVSAAWRAQTIAVHPSSSVTFNDSGSGTVTLSGAGTESQAHAATATGTIVLSGSGVESYVPGGSSFTDSGTGTITLSGSRTESQAHSGSGAGVITLAGTRLESQTHTASRSGSITLGGSRADSQTHTATAAGTVVISGVGSENYVPPGAITPTTADEQIARFISIHS